MRRRGLLALLAGLAGCASPQSTDRPGRTSTADGTPATTGSTTTGPGTGTGTAPATGTAPGTGTTTEESPGACSSTPVTFRLPVETRPDPLDEASARRVAVEVEVAYLRTLSIGPELFPQVPDDADSLSFEPGRPDDASVRPVDGGYEVTVRGRVEYVLPGRDRADQDGVDRPVDLAIYRVTDRGLARVRGVGDVSGTVICW